MTIDSRPTLFVSAVIWLLALVAAYATAALVNIPLFLYCGREACVSGSFWSSLPGWLAVAAGCWFVRHRGNRAKAALAGAAVALTLAASNAPLRVQSPLSFSIVRFPGDFLIGLAFAPFSATLLAPAPAHLLFLSPLVGAGALFTVIVRSAVPESSRMRRTRTVAGGLLMGAALLAEIVTTPTVWSPPVHRRIAEFALEVPAGSVSTPYRAWARQQVHFTVPPNPPADTVLMFYDQLFKGWRRLDRTTDDGIWLDPSGTVLAWAYCLDANAYVSLTDLNRGIWYQRSRRTSNGDRIVDLATRSGEF